MHEESRLSSFTACDIFDLLWGFYLHFVGADRTHSWPRTSEEITSQLTASFELHDICRPDAIPPPSCTSSDSTLDLGDLAKLFSVGLVRRIWFASGLWYSPMTSKSMMTTRFPNTNRTMVISTNPGSLRESIGNSTNCIRVSLREFCTTLQCLIS
ncbi:hypothetical protein HGRIS_011611 [Hohenbuehelia grisea]|uniref:Uncharacterized protein n=1 Tax=Hohenbuehelia grisea TaxID=104357 RepID=A0ABR3JWL4_9AGAR